MATAASNEGISSTSRAAWRSIGLGDRDLQTGWSQQAWIRPEVTVDYSQADDVELSLLTSTDAELPLGGSMQQRNALQGDSNRHQLAEAWDTPLLRKLCYPYEQEAQASTVSTTAFTPTPSTPWPHARNLKSMTDLARLPSAAVLNSLAPQTVTVDVIVGIISITGPTAVTVKRTGRSIDLVELLVGDETFRGFSITIWMTDSRKRTGPFRKPASKCSLTPAPAHDVALDLRVGNVVCISHLALKSRSKNLVCGQCLGTTTKIARLEESTRLAGKAFGLQTALSEKLERVRTWTRDFAPARIPAAPKTRRESDAWRKRSRLSDASLPMDDTPR